MVAPVNHVQDLAVPWADHDQKHKFITVASDTRGTAMN